MRLKAGGSNPRDRFAVAFGKAKASSMTVESNGVIRDSSYMKVGEVDSNGTVLNSSYSTVGHVQSNGTILNSSYTTVGHVESNGTILNSSYGKAGEVSGAVNIYQAGGAALLLLPI